MIGLLDIFNLGSNSSDKKFANGGEVKSTYEGRYLTVSIYQNRLVLNPTEEGIEEINDLLKDGKSDAEIMYNLFEDIQANSDLIFHYNLGESKFGLTEASGITKGYYLDDDGDYIGEEESELYYFNDYAVRSEIDDLLNGELVFSKHAEFANGGSLSFTGWDGIPFQHDTRPFAVIASMNLSSDEIKDEAKHALQNNEIDEIDYNRIIWYLENVKDKKHASGGSVGNTVTIQPYTYYGFNYKKQTVYVDTKYPSPDPSKVMLWSYGEIDSDVSDFKKYFEKSGKPITLTYALPKYATANQEKGIRAKTIREYVSNSHEVKESGGNIYNFKKGDVVFHKNHNTIGIVRDVFDKGELRTDADGVVNIDELEIYNKSNPTHQKAHIAPSTKKELGNRYANGGEVSSSQPDYKFNYMMLSRLQGDCEYFLGWGNRSLRHLRGESIDTHINEMKRLWHTFPANMKPQWLSLEDIENYEAKMKDDSLPQNYAKGGGVRDEMSFEEMEQHEKGKYIHYNPMSSRWQVWDNGKLKEFWTQAEAEKFAGFDYDAEIDSRYSRKKYETLMYSNGGELSNEERIVNLEFEDNTDLKHGSYSFSFETIDAEGSPILDYDGEIVLAPENSRRDDEFNWGVNTPEDWETAEEYILKKFYDWKYKKERFGKSGIVEVHPKHAHRSDVDELLNWLNENDYFYKRTHTNLSRQRNELPFVQISLDENSDKEELLSYLTRKQWEYVNLYQDGGWVEVVQDFDRGWHDTYSEGGNVENKVDTLYLKFNDLDEYYKAKRYFKTDSSFYPYEYNDEFKSIAFAVDGQEDADSTEYYIDQELQESDFSGYYFESDGGSLSFQHGGDVKKYPPLNSVDVIFDNPEYNYSTSISSSATEEDARKYFVGKYFDMGVFPKENFQKVIDIKFHKGIEERTFENGGWVEVVQDFDKQWSEEYAKGGKVNSIDDMAKLELTKIAEYSKKIYDMLNGNKPVETWIVAKISKIEETLSAVKHVLEYENPEMFNEGGNIVDAKEQTEYLKMQLLHIGTYAPKVLNAMNNGIILDGWMLKKIIISGNSISSVKHYLDYFYGNKTLQEGGNVVASVQEYDIPNTLLEQPISLADGGKVATVEIESTRKNIMGTLSIIMKISGMRKAQEFSVYPIKSGDTKMMIQSDTRIGLVDLTSGKGIMSQSHASGAYGVHLQTDKLTRFDFSDEQFKMLKEKIAQTAGSKVGSSVVFTDNSGADKFEDGGSVIESFRLPASDTTPVGGGGIPSYNTPLDHWALYYERGGKMPEKRDDLITTSFLVEFKHDGKFKIAVVYANNAEEAIDIVKYQLQLKSRIAKVVDTISNNKPMPKGIYQIKEIKGLLNKSKEKKLKANDLGIGTKLKHKGTGVKVNVWNVDPQLGKMQIERDGVKDTLWRSAKDWEVIN